MKHNDNLDEAALQAFIDKKNNPVYHNRMYHHKTMDTVLKLLNSNVRKYAIDASSAMGDYGRIVTILKETIADPTTIIMQTSYAVPGSRMWQLAHGAKEIYFNKVVGKVPVRADVRRISGMGQHADANELVAHVKHIHPPEKNTPFHIYIKHGSKASCDALKTKLINVGYKPETVTVMRKGESYNI